VSSVSVALASSTVIVGQSTTATATPRDAQGNAISGKTPSWTTSNSSVATVSSSGQVSAVSVGTADIVATVDGRAGQATVTVTPVPVANVTVTLNSASISTGQSTQAAAVTRDAQGNTLTGRTVAWTSSNAAVATVTAAGLVTGVSAGTANIVATSEGQSGQASVTVVPSVTVSGFVLRAPGGGALDTSNVAGTFEISADVELPTGFRGVREVKLGTRVVARDSVFGGSGLSARVSPFLFLVETTSATRVITADELTATADFPNGRHLVDLTFTGQLPNGTPVTRTVQGAIHTRNANAFRLFVEPTRQVTVDGRVIDTGNMTGRVDYVSFDGSLLDRIEISRGPAQTQYGSQAIPGVVSIVTLQGSAARKPFTFNLSGFESDINGTRFLIESIVSGQTTYFPRQQAWSVSGNASSVDGSGWVTPSTALNGITIAGGLRYQRTAGVPAGVLPPTFQEVSYATRWIDNLSPRFQVGLVAPRDRNLTLGGRAYDVDGKLGLTFNYLNSSTSLDDFLHPEKFLPDLTGTPEANEFEWYLGTSLPTLFNSSNRITSLTGRTASLLRDSYLGARGADGAGNFFTQVATTTLGNPYTTGNVVAPSNQIGTAPAVWGYLDNAGTINRTGVRSGSVFNAAGVAASSYAFEVTGGQYRPNSVFGTLRDYLDPTDCYRGFDNCTVPRVLGGSVNSSTGTLTYSEPISAMIAARVAVEGGSGDGLYARQDWAGDNAGGWAPWGMSMGWWGGLVDRVAPTVAATVTTHAPNDVEVSVSGTDGQGIEALGVAVRLDFNNSLFPGGKLFSWFDYYKVGGTLDSGLTTTVQHALRGAPPTHGAFFDPTSGVAAGPLFPVIGGTVRTRDWAHNYSQYLHVNYTPSGSAPTIPAGYSYFFSMSSNTVCRDYTCPTGQTSEHFYRVNVRSPTSAAPLSKAAMQLIPVGGGQVYHVGTDYTPTTTTVTGGFNHLYEVKWHADKVCIPPGLYFAKVMLLLTIQHQLLLFNNPFLTLNVTGTNAACTRAIRSLGYAYPPPTDAVDPVGRVGPGSRR